MGPEHCINQISPSPNSCLKCKDFNNAPPKSLPSPSISICAKSNQHRSLQCPSIFMKADSWCASVSERYLSLSINTSIAILLTTRWASSVHLYAQWHRQQNNNAYLNMALQRIPSNISIQNWIFSVDFGVGMYVINKPCSHHAITRCMPVGTVSKIAMWAELHTHNIHAGWWCEHARLFTERRMHSSECCERHRLLQLTAAEQGTSLVSTCTDQSTSLPTLQRTQHAKVTRYADSLLTYTSWHTDIFTVW